MFQRNGSYYILIRNIIILNLYLKNCDKKRDTFYDRIQHNSIHDRHLEKIRETLIRAPWVYLVFHDNERGTKKTNNHFTFLPALLTKVRPATVPAPEPGVCVLRKYCWTKVRPATARRAARRMRRVTQIHKSEKRGRLTMMIAMHWCPRSFLGSRNGSCYLLHLSLAISTQF